MTFEEIVRRIQRVLMLDNAAIIEVRDDPRFTSVSLAAAAIAVLCAGIGAWLYGELVLDFTPNGWFTDTMIFGTLFTIILFLAGVVVTYAVLTQLFHVDIAPDALGRVVLVSHIPYAIGLLVCIEEIGYAFGLFSVAAMFFYTVHGVLVAAPGARPMQGIASVAAGFAVWLLVIPIISDPGEAFVTGVFVYGLIA